MSCGFFIVLSNFSNASRKLLVLHVLYAFKITVDNLRNINAFIACAVIEGTVPAGVDVFAVE